MELVNIAERVAALSGTALIVLAIVLVWAGKVYPSWYVNELRKRIVDLEQKIEELSDTIEETESELTSLGSKVTRRRRSGR